MMSFDEFFDLVMGAEGMKESRLRAIIHRARYFYNIGIPTQKVGEWLIAAGERHLPQSKSTDSEN